MVISDCVIKVYSLVELQLFSNSVFYDSIVRQILVLHDNGCAAAYMGIIVWDKEGVGSCAQWGSCLYYSNPLLTDTRQVKEVRVLHTRATVLILHLP